MCLLAPESQFTVENACCNFMRPLELSSTLCAGQKKREKAIFIYYLLFFFCFQTRPWLPLFYRKGHGPNAKRGKSSCLAGFKVSDRSWGEKWYIGRQALCFGSFLGRRPCLWVAPSGTWHLFLTFPLSHAVTKHCLHLRHIRSIFYWPFLENSYTYITKLQSLLWDFWRGGKALGVGVRRWGF